MNGPVLPLHSEALLGPSVKLRALHVCLFRVVIVRLERQHWMLSAWSRLPCSALTGSFVRGYSLPFPTLLECVLPVGTRSLSSWLEENFLLHLVRQWNMCG